MITVAAGTSASSIQHLINTAAAGETISLAKGVFAFDRTVVINRDDITVTGAGSAETKIVMTPGSRGEGAFQIGMPIDKPFSGTSHKLALDTKEGAAALTLTSTSGLQAGDHLWLERPNTKAFLNEIGDRLWRQDKPLRTSLVEIESVSGNTVTLKNGLAFDFAKGDAVIRKVDLAENVHLGGFTFDSSLGDANPAKFANVKSAYDRVAAISASGTDSLVLSDIHVEDAASLGFNFGKSLFTDARDLSVNGAHNKGDGGNGYAFQIRDVYNGTFANLEAIDTRHAVVFASWTSSANNKIHVSDTNRDINIHGGRHHGNVVVVDNSVRTDAQAEFMSPTVFVNESGTTYGAPTDANANTVVFSTVRATNKADTIRASDGGARIEARGGHDKVHGGAGSDLLDGGAGNDTLNGNAGSDVIFGAAGNDNLHGGADGDAVFGNEGNDKLYGDAGDDWLYGGLGIDHLYGGTGTDTVSYSQALKGVRVDLAQQTAFDGKHTDKLNSIENAEGSAFNDVLMGDGKANTFEGLAGSDRISGGGGSDTVSYANSAGGVVVDLLLQTAYHAGSTDYLSSIENVIGSHGDDLLRGDAGSNRLDGGAGLNALLGGGGNDIFVFGDAGSRSTIADFSDDLIDVSYLGVTSDNFSTLVSFSGGQDCEITIGDSVMTLLNTSSSTLSSNDFLLA